MDASKESVCVVNLQGGQPAGLMTVTGFRVSVLCSLAVVQFGSWPLAERSAPVAVRLQGTLPFCVWMASHERPAMGLAGVWGAVESQQPRTMVVLFDRR